MALEKSMLTEQTAAELLETHYGVRMRHMRRMALGTANCYCVSDGSRQYFLKEFQSGFSGEVVSREAALNETLAQRGIPVARFYHTRDGTAYLMRRGHAVCLEEYIEGETYGYNGFPENLLTEAARMLGRLHTAMRDIRLPAGMDETWLAAFSPEGLAAQYDALLVRALDLPENEKHVRLVRDLRYKKALAQRCGDYRKAYAGITRTPTHGDYQGCQLISEGGMIRAVIDFSAARTLPAVWEVMRSYVQTSADSREHARIDLPGLCDYVRAYLEYAPLTRVDLAAAPYVYLFQLARSKFGYTEYLQTDSEDREGLLAFAFWRTDMCREVERRAGEIAQALVRCGEEKPA